MAQPAGTRASAQNSMLTALNPSSRLVCLLQMCYHNGVVYIADSNNHVIRAIDIATYVVSTYAGTPGVPGSADHATNRNSATFNLPYDVACDTSNGDLYVGA
eukprot:354399-Chlamydomonas_euryale.AAC.4